MRRSLLPILLLCLSAFAKDKPHYTYQDALLVSFRDVVSGSSCVHSSETTGDVKANTDDGYTSGTVNATTTGTSECSNNASRLYTINVAGQTYIIRHSMTGGQMATAMVTMGWGALFMKQSVLANQLPGTHVFVRSDEHGLYVKLGKRESRFKVVEAK